MPARSNLATLFLESALYEDALVQFRRLYEVAPHSPLGHEGLAESLLALHRHEEALNVVEAGLHQFPDSPSLTIALARLSLHAGKLPNAMALLRKVAGRNDDYGVQACAWLAVGHLTASAPEDAVGAAQRALALAPDHPLASYVLAVSLDTLNAPEAKQWLEQAFRLNPSNQELQARISRRAN